MENLKYTMERNSLNESKVAKFACPSRPKHEWGQPKKWDLVLLTTTVDLIGRKLIPKYLVLSLSFPMKISLWQLTKIWYGVKIRTPKNMAMTTKFPILVIKFPILVVPPTTNCRAEFYYPREAGLSCFLETPLKADSGFLKYQET